MNFVDYLSQEATSSITNLHLFLLNQKKKEFSVHVFFEGKTDESFYGTHILKYKNHKYSYFSYHCGNKEKVYDTYSKINTRVKKNNIALFFVDKDLDDVVPIKRVKRKYIYVTDFYSIENYLVNPEILERIWAEIYKLKSGTEIFKTVFDKFSECHNNFNTYLKEIMSWIIYQRRKGTSLCLNDIKLSNFFEINDELEFLHKINIDEIINKCDEMCNTTTSKAAQKDIKNIITELDKIRSKNYIRGKFELYFFILFLNKLSECLYEAYKMKKRKFKNSLPINSINAIDILAPRINCPESLSIFLNKCLS